MSNLAGGAMKLFLWLFFFHFSEIQFICINVVMGGPRGRVGKVLEFQRS